MVKVTVTAVAAAAPRRRTSMADDNRGVSGGATATAVAAVAATTVAAVAAAATAATAAVVIVVTIVVAAVSPPLFVTVVALRARRAVVSGAHRVHMYATYLSPFSEINKQCRGHSSRAPRRESRPESDVLITLSPLYRLPPSRRCSPLMSS